MVWKTRLVMALLVLFFAMGQVPLYHGTLYNHTPYDIEVVIVKLENDVGSVIDAFSIEAGKLREVALPRGLYTILSRCPLGIAITKYDLPDGLAEPDRPFNLYFKSNGKEI